MYCHHCGSTCTTGYYLCPCGFALLLRCILHTPFRQRSGLVPSDRPQPTGDVTDPCSSPFMLSGTNRDTLQLLQLLQPLLAFHSLRASHKILPFFLMPLLDWMNQKEKKKSPISKRLLGSIPWCGQAASIIASARVSISTLPRWYAGIINTASPFQGMRIVDLEHPL